MLINLGIYYVVYSFFDEKINWILGVICFYYFLKEGSVYLNEGDEVICLVYVKLDLGFKVVIDEKVLGFIFYSDVFKLLKVG